jgi:hypothetical protein
MNSSNKAGTPKSQDRVGAEAVEEVNKARKVKTVPGNTADNTIIANENYIHDLSIFHQHMIFWSIVMQSKPLSADQSESWLAAIKFDGSIPNLGYS